MIHRFAIALCALSLLVVSGCGGGGGGGSSNAPWSALSREPGAATVPGVTTAFTDGGDGIALWVADGDYRPRVLVSTYSVVSGAWSAEQSLFLGGPFEFIQYAVASGPNEIGILIASGSKLYALTWSGGSFGTPTLLDQTADATWRFDDLALRRVGSGFGAAWRRTESRDPSTFQSQYSARGSVKMAGSGWTSPTTLGGTGSVGEVAAASNGSGFLVAFTLDGDLFARSHSLAGWSGSPVLVDELSGTARNPALASNGSDYQLAWLQHDGTATSAFTVRFDSVGTKSAVTPLESTNDSVNSIGIASNGANYLAALGMGSPSRLFATIGVGPTWSPPQAVSGAGSGEGVAAVSLATNGAGYAMSWTQNDANGHRSQWGSVYNGAWSPATLLETSDGAVWSIVPSIVSNGNGYLAAWIQYDSPSTALRSLFTNVYSAGAWSGPTAMETGTGQIDRAFPAARGGSYVVAWPQVVADGSYTAVNVRERPAGATAWSGRIDLVDVLRGGSAFPERLLGNGSGGTFAAWSQTRNGDSVTRFAARSAAGPWQVVVLDDPNSEGFDRDAVATDGVGYAVAIRENGSAPNSGRLQVRRFDGQAWTGPEYPGGSGLTGSVQSMQIASNGAGYAAAWVQRPAPGEEQVVYASVFDGTSWGAPMELSDGGDVQSARIASNGTGYAVTWDTINDGTLPVNVYDGTSWSGLRVVANPTSQSFPRVRSNGTGYLVTWSENDAGVGGHANFAVVSPTGGADDFQPPVRTSSATREARRPVIATNGAGYAMAWTESNAVSDAYVMGSVFDGGAWSAPVRLNMGDRPAEELGIASDGDGYAAAWLQRDTAQPSPRTLTAAVFAGGSWGAAMPLESTNDPVNEDEEGGVQIVSDGAGYQAAWVRRPLAGSGLNHLYLSRFDGASWTSTPIGPDSASAYYVHLDAAGGKLRLLWVQPDPSGDPAVLLPWIWIGVE